jgi:hypothetical protein
LIGLMREVTALQAREYTATVADRDKQWAGGVSAKEEWAVLYAVC